MEDDIVVIGRNKCLLLSCKRKKIFFLIRIICRILCYFLGISFGYISRTFDRCFFISCTIMALREHFEQKKLN